MVHIKVGRCLLKSILEEKKMTQTDLAILAGITKQEINSYAQNKRNMSLKTAKTIAYILNCKIDSLYEWEINE